ncbi:MAG TPA: NAD(P)H-dependent oxidoreductase [Ilumatobacteraceae bacterium]|nr:NAD(P)H-dependent oxidoreductase [Ilumatobacteraceae bacterium]
MKTLLVYCHPNDQSFVAAARDAALAGLDAGGHEVRVRDLYAERFDPVFSADDRTNHRLPLSVKPHIAGHAADLAWCEQLVLVYPTWWAGQPAMLKGWIDRVWVNEVAWTLPAGSNRIRRGLTNIRRITVVTSHGSSKLINALEGEGGKRVVSRSLRLMCNRWCRLRWLALYGIDTAAPAARDAFLAKVRTRLAG